MCIRDSSWVPRMGNSNVSAPMYHAFKVFGEDALLGLGLVGGDVPSGFRVEPGDEQLVAWST